MTAPIYANLAQYRTWLVDDTATVSAGLFARASEIVDEVLIGAVYTLDDTTQLPTDATVLEALRDATCAQVQWMDAVGDTTGTGDTYEVDSASIGSVSFSGARRQTTAGRTSSGAEVAAGTLRILRIAGIAPTVWTYG